MVTVALIGPDGVGKTTIASRLVETMPTPTRYVYMGVNVDASNVALQSSRWINALRKRMGRPSKGGPLEHSQANVKPKGPFRRILTGCKRSVLLVNQIADEAYRQMVIRSYRLRGYLVILDRDFFADFYAYDIAKSDSKSFTRRIHGFLLQRFYRRPDLFIYLNADAQTMFERKREGSIALLERRRSDYLELARVVKNFAVVDANQPLADVVAEVKARIIKFQEPKSQPIIGHQNSTMASNQEGAQS